MVCSITRGPAKPIRAPGSAMLRSPSMAKEAVTPPVVGSVSTEREGSRAVRRREGAAAPGAAGGGGPRFSPSASAKGPPPACGPPRGGDDDQRHLAVDGPLG